MKKAVFTGLLVFLTINRLLSQVKSPDQQKSYQQTVAFGVSLPVGVFSESHIAGLSSSYSWSNHRFGQLGSLPKKIIGFTAHGGIDYYFGKKITTAGYESKYGGYMYVHAFGGAIYNPCKRGNITLTTGPTLGLYKGRANAGFGATLNGSYYFTERIALTPGIMYMKHALVNTLWSTMIKASYNF